MRTTAPQLLPILRSQVQGDLLAELYLHPEEEHSITDLAVIIGASVKSVQQEVDRLVRAGYLEDRRLGTSRLVRAVQGGVLTRPLTDLLAVTYGPLSVLTRALKDVEDVEQALIYGSWAARYLGEPGPPPADVDVLVIGYADPDELHERAEQAERVLRREVNIRRIRPKIWDRGEDPFVASVQGRPMVDLDLGEQREENREVATGSR